MFTLKMYSFFYIPIQMDFKQNFFELFTFVKILNHLQVQDLSNKKKTQLSASSVGSDIPPTIY